MIKENPPVSNLVNHANQELTDAGLFDKDSDYNGELGKAALEIVKVFAAQGHSGMSAAIVTDIVEKLMRFEPLSPLTGQPEEWADVTGPSGYPLWQNKRCGRIFKGEDDIAYDVEGKIFRDPDGSTWTNADSHVPVTFPYTIASPQIVDREQTNG